MKKSIKFLLVAALALGATSLFAQKFGRINYQTLIESMPEMTDVMAKMDEVSKEYQDHLEGLQVEYNNKTNDLQNATGISESVRQLRTREVAELYQRLQEYYGIAQQELQKTNSDLTAPLMEKADAAIKKICKAQNIVAVFQVDTLVYLDEDATIDITAPVKAELGIK